MNRYLPILTLEVKHDYFENGYLKGATIQPNLSTSPWLRANGLLLQTQGHQAKLYAQQSNDIDSLIKNAPENFALTFEYRIDDPYFYNYTNEMPEGTESTLKFTLPPTVEGQQPEEIALISNQEYGKVSNAHFLLEIPVAVVNAEKPKTLVIPFTTRAIAWRYYLISVNIDLQAIRLGGRDAQLFSGPKETTIVNGQKALLFDSGNHLIPLKEIPEIELQVLAENSDTVLISKMPAASPQIVRAEKDGEGQLRFFTDIFVYL